MYYKPAKYIITIFVFFTSQMCYSQHLSFQDLQNLFNENSEENSTLLFKRGFIYKNSKKNTDKSEELSWMYNSPGSNSSNEYFYKSCSSLFLNKCEKITYLTSSEKHFVALKNSMQLKFNKFLTSNTNEKGVLFLYFVIPGPLIAKFCTIPNAPRVFAIELEHLKEENKLMLN